MRATNGIPLGVFTFLPVHTVNSVPTLKVTINPNTFGFHVEKRAWTTGDNVIVTLTMKPRIELAKTINVGGIAPNAKPFNSNRNNVVQGGLPYATVNLGPLRFALPLEKAGSEWRYALVQTQTLTKP